MGLFLCRQVGSVGSFPGRLLNRISSCEMGALHVIELVRKKC